MPNSLENECSSFVSLPNQMVTFFGLWNSSQITGLWREPSSTASQPSPPPLRIFQLVMTGSGSQSAFGSIVVQLESGESISSPVDCRIPVTTTATTTQQPTIGPGPVVEFIVQPLPPPAACPTASVALITARSQIPLISSFASLMVANGSILSGTPNLGLTDPCRTSLIFGTTPAADIDFRGIYGSNIGIDGGWSNALNLPAGPGDVDLLYVVLLGTEQAKLEGQFLVTAESQVVPFEGNVCLGPGCSSTTSTFGTTTITATLATSSTLATSTAAPTTRPLPTPPPFDPNCVQFLPTIQENPAGCPELITCSFLVNNSCTPLISAFANLRLENGSFVPSMPRNDTTDECQSFVALPSTSVMFRGTWNEDTIDGEWSDNLNVDSDLAPPPLEILQLTLSGSRPTARGMIGVTNPAVVTWSTEICCGCDCPGAPPSCGTTTSTTLATSTASTTTETGATTTPPIVSSSTLITATSTATTSTAGDLTTSTAGDSTTSLTSAATTSTAGDSTTSTAGDSTTSTAGDSTTSTAGDSTTSSTSAATTTGVPTTTPVPGSCPNATDIEFSILLNAILINSVTRNDIGCNGASPPTSGTVNVTLVSGPSSGTLSLQENGEFVFTPVFNSLENVTFTYRLCDTTVSNACDDAVVAIILVPQGCFPIARPDAYVADASNQWMVMNSVVLNDSSSACNPSGPSRTPPAGDFEVTAPLSCESASAVSCLLANFTADANGVFRFILDDPTAACVSDYSVVEACLSVLGATLDSCRARCSVLYRYRLSETAGPQPQSAESTVTIQVVPPVVHMTTSVTCEASSRPLTVGEDANFLIQLSNAGPQTATGIQVRIGVASGLDVGTTSASSGSIGAVDADRAIVWTLPSMAANGVAVARVSTRILFSNDSYVVTSLVQMTAEFDYSVVGHFSVKQILPGVPVPPNAPNQTFSVTNSSCSTFDILGAVIDANGNLNPSSVSLILYPTTRGTVQLLSDFTVKFTPQEGFLGSTCFGYRVCDFSNLCDQGKIFVNVLPQTDSSMQVNVFFGL